jgi:hypothetical protein
MKLKKPPGWRVFLVQASYNLTTLIFLGRERNEDARLELD